MDAKNMLEMSIIMSFEVLTHCGLIKMANMHFVNE